MTSRPHTGYCPQSNPDSTITLYNGVEATPLITLQSDAGYKIHIIEDDNCYVLCIPDEDGRYKFTSWWPQEVPDALQVKYTDVHASVDLPLL